MFTASTWSPGPVPAGKGRSFGAMPSYTRRAVSFHELMFTPVASVLVFAKRPLAVKLPPTW